MTLVDLTREISPETQVFPAYPKVAVLLWAKHEVHGFRAEILHMATHTATHLDAPLHFIEDGQTVDQLSLEVFTGYAVAVDVRGEREVSRDLLRKRLDEAPYQAGDAVFLYTGWEHRYGSREYLSENPGLSAEAAQLLVDVRAKLVGIDTRSLDPATSTTFPAHRILLKTGIPIIENLCNLSKILQSRVKYYAFPLKIEGATASPVRVVAEI